MTVATGVGKSSDILNSQIKTDFNAFKQSIEKLVSIPDIHSYGIQVSAQIEDLLLELNKTDDLISKSQKLLRVSDLSLKLSEFVTQNPSQKLVEFSKLTELLGRRTEVYGTILLAFNLILEAERDKALSLSSQFQKYALGFEMLASALETRWQFLSIEALKQIELSADAALNFELENRQKYSPKSNPEFAELAKSMRRSVASVLFMVDRIEYSKKDEGFRSLKNSLTPFMQHLAATQEEQIQKNKGAITWAETILKEAKKNIATPEEIEEYREIEEILKRNE